MGKKLILSLCVLCFGLLVFTTSASANKTCNGVTVVETGTTIYTDSGIYVILHNNTGANCGKLLDGSEFRYYLDPLNNVDREYATILTAMSLDKEMNVTIAGKAEANSLIVQLGIKNPVTP